MAVSKQHYFFLKIICAIVKHDRADDISVKIWCMILLTNNNLLTLIHGRADVSLAVPQCLAVT